MRLVLSLGVGVLIFEAILCIKPGDSYLLCFTLRLIHHVDIFLESSRFHLRLSICFAVEILLDERGPSTSSIILLIVSLVANAALVYEALLVQGSSSSEGFGLLLLLFS